MSTSNCAPRHVWTKEEEGTLVECLMELVSMGDENRIMVRATTVIDCRIKTLKQTFQAIVEMHGPACSGFEWNDEEKFASCSEGTPEQTFPYYDLHICLVEIGRRVGSLRHLPTWGLTSLAGMTDLIWGMETRSSRPCTARGLTSRKTMYVYPNLLALQRVGPDQVDPKERGEVSETWMLKAYIWRSTKQTSNSG
ncbi:retrotransposon protein [Cucumis melo var. makuwa]|uniref:Retrotransposon protein n=1 Tax=Cucumis melo var. makuwa TaxID=1194695 RepID=A0A5D3CXZ7_CUCMM|nr:retrotransposon protein [Cucumis melo var. makuwa]